MTSFESFGFATAYTVEADPEYPASGDFAERSVTLDPSVDPTLVGVLWRITPDDGEPFLVRAKNAPGRRAYATPNPHVVYVRAEQSELTGLLIDVRAPTSPREVIAYMPQVWDASAAGLLLLESGGRFTAIDDTGVRWTSPRVALEDAEVVEVTTSAIRVDDPRGHGSPCTLDPRDGTLLSGRTLWGEQP